MHQKKCQLFIIHLLMQLNVETEKEKKTNQTHG